MKWNWQQNNWPQWSFDPQAMTGLEQAFLLNSGTLLGAWKHLSSDHQETLKVNFLCDEAVKTSAIEGEVLDRLSVQSSIRKQFGMKVDTDRSSPAEAGIAELMVACYQDFQVPVSDQLLFDWHKLICAGRIDMDSIGAYRTHKEAMQVVSGAIYKPRVHFEAPPSRNVPKEMKLFFKWLANTKQNGTTPLPALARAGLVHLYFVSIHPFEDGNGRLARTLSEKVLAEVLGSPSLVALSRQIEKQRKQYYQALEHNNQDMEITPWLVWFAQTILKAQDHSIKLIDHLIAKTKMMDRLRGQINPRQEKVLMRLFDAGPDGFDGGLSAKNYRTITGAPTATTTRDLRDLVSKGALTSTGERKGVRYWLNI